jgi:hypothetical protein
MTKTDTVRGRPRWAFAPLAEGLEGRRLLSNARPDLALISTSTTDSRGVTVNYEVTGEALDAPPTFAVHRSADAVLDDDDPLVGEVAGGALDAAGEPSTAAGSGMPQCATSGWPGQ